MPDTRGGTDATAQLAALQNERVEDWVRMIRQAAIVAAAVERSLSWRLTRPVRLGQTAVRVLRRDGAGRFWATVFYRLRRLASRR
ncbi:MAG: hypothetical protein ABI632_13100 [Pseudolysinimonas sp.]